MGDMDPHLTHDSFGPPESTTQTTCGSISAVLAGLMIMTD